MKINVHENSKLVLTMFSPTLVNYVECWVKQWIFFSPLFYTIIYLCITWLVVYLTFPNILPHQSEGDNNKIELLNGLILLMWNLSKLLDLQSTKRDKQIVF